MIQEKLSGTGVALVTPLLSNRNVDFDNLSKLIDHVIEGGVDYLVCLGTTGESPTFSWTEKIEILNHTIAAAKDRVPVVFGLGSNSTQEVLGKMDEIQSLPIDAILSVSPYYNRPSQDGLLRHYHAIAEASSKPVIIYNVPGRTSSNVDAKTVLALAKHENIIGIKDATADMFQLSTLAREKPEGFLLISGEDSLSLPTMSVGGEGLISVLANLLPKEISEMIRSAIAGDFEKARSLHLQLLPFFKLSTLEGNPPSIKTGLQALGIGERYVRSPLFEGSKALLEQFVAALSQKKGVTSTP